MSWVAAPRDDVWMVAPGHGYWSDVDAARAARQLTADCVPPDLVPVAADAPPYVVTWSGPLPWGPRWVESEECHTAHAGPVTMKVVRRRFQDGAETVTSWWWYVLVLGQELARGPVGIRQSVDEGKAAAVEVARRFRDAILL